MLPKADNMDLRTLRTRRSLVQALIELLEEKDLQTVTVGDIAERAMINRATFYAHFVDKYDLFAYVIRVTLQDALSRKIPDIMASPDHSSPPFNHEHLTLLTQAVFDFMVQVNSRCQVSLRKQFQPMAEAQVQAQLYELLLEWLDTTALANLPAPLEVTASVMSWAIFGVALQWSRDWRDKSAAEVSKQVLSLLAVDL